MSDLAKRAERAALCLEAWSEGRGPHANVREVSGALAKTVRALMIELYGPYVKSPTRSDGHSAE